MSMITLEIVGLMLLFLIFSRRLFDLSLSLFVTSSTIMVSLIALSISALILSIAAIPTIVIGCKVAERHYGKMNMPENFALVCGEPSRAPKIVGSRRIESYPQRTVVHSEPGKY